jgi:type IV pilus assembly protein PilV
MLTSPLTSPNNNSIARFRFMRSNSISTGPRRSGAVEGFSLVEVLIALIIMSVGMLGIAGLYVHSMQAGRTSLFRHHAVTLAGDVADRIRANPRAGVAYEGAGSSDDRCIADAVDCTPDEIAAYDIFLWEDQADETLPEGDVTIVYSNAAVPSTYEVTVTWKEAGYEVDPTYTVSFPVFEMLP